RGFQIPYRGAHIGERRLGFEEPSIGITRAIPCVDYRTIGEVLCCTAARRAKIISKIIFDLAIISLRNRIKEETALEPGCINACRTLTVADRGARLIEAESRLRVTSEQASRPDLVVKLLAIVVAGHQTLPLLRQLVSPGMGWTRQALWGGCYSGHFLPEPAAVISAPE